MKAGATLVLLLLAVAAGSCSEGGKVADGGDYDRVITHRVLPGETWESISKEYYGSAERAKALARFNHSKSEGEIKAGTGVKVPLLRRDISRMSSRLKAMDLYNDGVGMARRGDYPGAVEKFESALAIEPDASEASFNLAVAYQKMGRHEDALKILRGLIEKTPERADYRFAIGNSLFYLGRYEEAAESFQRALECDPDHLQSLFALAATREKMGRRKEAIEAWQRYLDKAPEGEWAEEARDRMEKLRRGGAEDGH